MTGKLHTVARVVAGNVVNNGQFALCNSHHILNDYLAFLHALIDAFTRRAVDIHAFDALIDKVLRQRTYTLRAYISLSS